MSFSNETWKMQEILEKYLPPKAVPHCVAILQRYGIRLTIAKHRVSKLGDYTPPRASGEPHRISVNGSLNPYSFLITFVHEVAHLLTWQAYRGRVSPHGAEWKQHFRQVMDIFLKEEIFPVSVYQALQEHLKNPFASSCRDEKLLEILSQYDLPKGNKEVFLKDLPTGSLFVLSNNVLQGRLFQKKDFLRKFFRCAEINSGKVYHIHALAKVIPYEANKS